MKRFLKASLLMSAAFLIGACSSDSSTGPNPPEGTAAPVVLSTTPLNSATAVVRNTSVTVTFNEVMLASSLNATTFQLRQGTTPVAASITYAGTVATLIPTSPLDANTVYTAMVTTGAKSATNVALEASVTWSFTTVATAAPVVLFTTPLNSATAVVRNTSVTVTFNEVMLASSLNATTFQLLQGTTPVAASITSAGTDATLIPTSPLAANTVYTAMVTTGATGVTNVALEAPVTWSFTTVATSVTGPQPVSLGTAGNYAILAKSAISTTGTTSVVGDLGLSPSAASFITGFGLSAPPTTFTTSPLVTGNVWAADYDAPTPTVLTTAVLDMQTAFTDAAGRTLPDFTELGTGNIDGMTLVPGLYKWGTGVSFTTGVTLAGSADAIWIFQVAQDLTVGNGAIVTLSGGAQAKNIYWQISGQATFGTTSSFKGIVLCQTLVALNTGATVTGRLLAQTAVTLDAATVINP